MKKITIGVFALVTLGVLATGGRVLAQGAASDLARILEAGAAGLTAYFAWLLDVLKIIW